MMMLAKYPLPHNPLILLWDRQDTQKLSLVTLPPFVGVQVRLTIVSALGSLKSSPDPSPPGNRATLLSVGRLLGSTSGRQKFDDFYFPFIALWPPCSPVTRSVLGLRGGESKYERERRTISMRGEERGDWLGLAVTSSSMFPVFAIIRIIPLQQAGRDRGRAKCLE